MAFFEMRCKSETRGKQIRVNVVIPGDRRAIEWWAILRGQTK